MYRLQTASPCLFGILCLLLLCSTKFAAATDTVLSSRTGSKRSSTRSSFATWHDSELSHFPIRPFEDPPLVVQVGLNVRKLVDLDISSGQLHLAVWFRIKWRDPRLFFNGTQEFGSNWETGVSSVPIPHQAVWKPDLLMTTATNDFFNDFTETDVYLYDETAANETGINMFWSRPGSFISKCHVDLANYPFDEQECEMRFESWMYDTHYLKVVPMPGLALSETAEVTDSIEEYQMMGWKVKEEIVHYAAASAYWSGATLVLKLRRKPHYYIQNMVLPLLTIAGMSAFTMWFPAGGEGRVTYAITVLLTVVACSLFTAEKRPAIGFDTWLGIFQARIFVISTIPVFESVSILWWQGWVEDTNNYSVFDAAVQTSMSFLGEKGNKCAMYSKKVWSPGNLDHAFRHLFPVWIMWLIYDTSIRIPTYAWESFAMSTAVQALTFPIVLMVVILLITNFMVASAAAHQLMKRFMVMRKRAAREKNAEDPLQKLAVPEGPFAEDVPQDAPEPTLQDLMNLVGELQTTLQKKQICPMEPNEPNKASACTCLDPGPMVIDNLAMADDQELKTCKDLQDERHKAPDNNRVLLAKSLQRPNSNDGTRQEDITGKLTHESRGEVEGMNEDTRVSLDSIAYWV